MNSCVVRENQEEERLDYNLVLEQLAINVCVMMAGGLSLYVYLTPYTKIKFRWTKTKRVKNKQTNLEVVKE